MNHAIRTVLVAAAAAALSFATVPQAGAAPKSASGKAKSAATSSKAKNVSGTQKSKATSSAARSKANSRR